MDAPPPDSIELYLDRRDLMLEAGLKAPAVYASDAARGFALIEDFGDGLYDRTLAEAPERSRELYQQAWEAIGKLQACPVEPGRLPSYDEALLDRELGLFPAWYAAKHRGSPLDEQETQDYGRICGLLKDAFAGQPQLPLHRDFHSRNLFALEDGLGVIDFSGAVVGPPTYDIASLLRDLYVDMDDEAELDYLARSWEHSRASGLPVASDFGEHYRLFEWVSLQRLVKILGLFVKLARSDGKESYLQHLPKCETLAHAVALRYRDLRPLATMIERRVP